MSIFKPIIFMQQLQNTSIIGSSGSLDPTFNLSLANHPIEINILSNGNTIISGQNVLTNLYDSNFNNLASLIRGVNIYAPIDDTIYSADFINANQYIVASTNNWTSINGGTINPPYSAYINSGFTFSSNGITYTSTPKKIRNSSTLGIVACGIFGIKCTNGSHSNTLGGSTAYDFAIQSDNNIVIAYGNGVTRLTSTLATDTTFTNYTGNTTMSCIGLQSTGKIIATNNTGALVRLNSDGTVDSTFNSGGSGITNYHSNSIRFKIQSDDKIVLVGDFDTYNGQNVYGIVRLNSNGTIDNTFNTGSGFNPTTGSSGSYNLPYCINIQSDGKILVGGAIISYNGTSNLNNIVRIFG